MNNQKLYELREYHDMTQQDVANILKVRQQTYGEWENQKRIIPLKHLVSLCNYYHVSLDYMTGLSQTKEQYQPITINPSNIGLNLIKFRLKHNLYQKEVATLLNTTPSTICAYEKGKTIILTAFAYEICKTYNLSLDWLLGCNVPMYRTKKTYVNA